MARIDSGRTVLHKSFLELELPTAAFDGIFANASLFHIPSQEIVRVLQELRMELVPDGILFSSNPRGSSEGWSGSNGGHYSPEQALVRCTEILNPGPLQAMLLAKEIGEGLLPMYGPRTSKYSLQGVIG